MKLISKRPPATSLLAVAAGLITLFAACHRQTSAAEIVVIGEDSANLQAMESLKGKFETTHNVTVRYIRDPFDLALQKSNQDFASGAGQFDIVCQYAASLAPFVNNNYVLTLADLTRLVPPSEVSRDFEADFFPGVWRETGFFRKTGAKEVTKVAYPFAATTMMLVYNRKLFSDPELGREYRSKFGQDLAVPATWEEFRRLAEFFTRPQQNMYGVAVEGAPGGYLYWEWANYAYGMGGGVMKKDAGWEGDASTPILLDSDANVAATNFFVDLRSFNAGDFFAVGSAEKRELFLKGNIAMAIMWSDYIPEMLKSSNADQIGFATIPGTKSMIGGATFFLNKSSRHPREATEYILSLLNHDEQVQLALRGLGSPFRSTYADPAVRRIPYSEALRESLERGVYMIEAGPDSQLIQDVITEKLQQMWRGTISVDRGLADAKQEIERKRVDLFRRVGQTH